MSHPIHSVDPVTKHSATQEASAQIAALVAKQEALLRFNKFDDEVAWEIGNIVRDLFIQARSSGKHAADAGIVIHIETFTGHVLFSCAVGKPPTVGPDNWCVKVEPTLARSKHEPGRGEGLVVEMRLGAG